MSFLSIDFETRSTVDLRKSGVYPYAEHPSTDVWCMSYAVPGSQPKTWLPGDPVPPVVTEVMRRGLPFRAWNASFEHIIWRDIMVPRYSFPAVPTDIWIDTAAEAAALSLPRSLSQAAQVLGMAQQKDDDGYKLMMKMCRPRSIGGIMLYHIGGQTYGPFATKNDANRYRIDILKLKPGEVQLQDNPSAVIWWDDPADIARLMQYCEQDVVTEMGIAEILLDLSPVEREVYLATQRMNDRGVGVDMQMVDAAADLNEIALREVNARLHQLTGLSSITKVHGIREWVNANSPLELDNLRKDTVRDLLNSTEPMSPEVREVLQLRQDAGKTSTAKLKSFENCVASDGRAHGLLLYHGASTGRWSGRLIQPQNFPRPTIDIDPLIGYIKGRGYDELVATGESVPNIISSALRSMICAAPGYELVAGDFAQIEARVLAWLAGQDDLVQLFRDGGKVYEDMAAFIFNMDVEDVAKDSFERQIGKNSILGCGFQMGADRFAEQVQEQTGIVLDRGGEFWYHHPCDQWGPPVVRDKDGEIIFDDAIEEWDCCPKMSAPRPRMREDIAQKAIDGYRSKNHHIKQFWWDIEEAAIEAVRNPGRVTRCGVNGCIRFKVAQGFLWCQLPSGRRLAYAQPEVRMRKLPEPYEHIEKPGLTFLGIDTFTRQWWRVRSYGGHLTENVVQAVARDLMAAAILRLEREGYTPVLTVHDEVVCEEAIGTKDLGDFLRVMNQVPNWATGLPVAGDGWKGDRYRK